MNLRIISICPQKFINYRRAVYFVKPSTWIILAALTVVSTVFSVYMLGDMGPEISEEGCDPSLWSHVYSPERFDVVDQCLYVSGVIESIKAEKDGNMRIKLTLDPEYIDLANDANKDYANGNLIVTAICQNETSEAAAIKACNGYSKKINIPPSGSHVTILGTYVIEKDTGWAEMHPISNITIS